MRKLLFLPGLFLILFILSCEEKESEPDRTGEADVVMVTDTGDIYIKLYDVTPRHKGNFLKLAREGFYDGMAFHRVIKDFIVQIGDPRSREGATTEEDDAGYKLEPEIVDTLLHTEGKIAAARYPDEVNPGWESSSSQFYIVTGRFVTEEELDQAEMAFNYAREMRLRREHAALQDSGVYEGRFNDFLSERGFKEIYYTEAQRAKYDQMQGAPNLDFQYTIFGEVVGGMDIVRKIERLPTRGDVPTIPVRIKEMRVVE